MLRQPTPNSVVNFVALHVPESSPMTTRRRHSKGNSKTKHRPQIGFKVDPQTGEPTRTQPRFNFGDDPKEFEYRLALVRRLYEENCKANGVECWSPLALHYAKSIEKGIYEIPFSVPQQLIDEGLKDDDLAIEYVFMLRCQQRDYPSLKLVAADEELYHRGVIANRRIESRRIHSLYNELLDEGTVESGSQIPGRIITGMLHEAFDAYIRHIQDTGLRLDEATLKVSQRKRIEYVECLKEHHDDVALQSLSFDCIAKMISYWTNRPETKYGGRYKPNSVRHRLKELERCLKWIDVTSQFSWEMPRGVETISRRIVTTEEDNESSSVITKHVYSPSQLALLNVQANSMERLLLYLGLNCAFGAAEAGRLTTDEILFNHRHQHTARLNFASSTADSFIRLNRPKSHMFGEWLLWPETAEMLRWGVERCRRLDSPFVICRDNGTVLYNEKSANPQSPFAKLWNELVGRVRQEHSDLPILPFGSLRDTLPDLLRHRYQDELAAICLAHKTAYKPDGLLDAYGNKPFGRLHTAIRELHEHYEPVFSAVRE